MGLQGPRKCGNVCEPGSNSWSGDSHLRSGGSVWSTPAVDPKRELIGFAGGNPNPDLDGHDRLGDNAYTNSIVGIGAEDGKLRWWHQEVPHDVWHAFRRQCRYRHDRMAV